MYKAHKESKKGICIAEPGGGGGYPAPEIDGYVVVSNREIFSKRSSVEERTAFLEAETKAGSCEKRDSYYFFKYQNLYGLGRP